MKTIRSYLTLGAMSLVLLALGTSQGKAKFIDIVEFEGNVILPLDTQWKSMVLPAGEYTLIYGSTYSGFRYVEVIGRAKGSPHGVVTFALGSGQGSATKNILVCLRKDNVLIVRSLELPAIGQRATFAMPRGVRLMAHNRNTGTNIQLAEVPVLTQRVPVRLTEK